MQMRLVVSVVYTAVVVLSAGLSPNSAFAQDATDTKPATIWYSEQFIFHSKSLERDFKPQAYVSQFIFYSDVPLLSLNPVLDTIGTRVSKDVSQNLKLPYVFQPSAVRLSIDPESQILPVQFFTVERREGTAFRENKYFSSAPVSTDTHISVIEEFERSMIKHAKTIAL
jgi:hypothetical protein